jgi:hypothetical protein
MMRAAKVLITVEFGESDRPPGYLVHMEPEGGSAVGKWSASGNINEKNQISFQNIPPGRYTLQGRANPTSAGKETLRLFVELHGGDETDIILVVP